MGCGMKIKNLLLLTIIMLLTFTWSGCKVEEREEMLVLSNTSSESIPLMGILKNAYSIEDLRAFFGLAQNESSKRLLITEQELLTGKYVNETFPVACIRETTAPFSYSIYQVKEGGYFYVFWLKDSGTSLEQIENIKAHFVTYITKRQTASDFDAIQVGSSSLAEVSAIDPARDLSLTMSKGVSTFSVLKDNTVLEILYEGSTEENMIVKSKDIISCEAAQSATYLALIYSGDFPERTTDDTSSLDQALTKEYDLSELSAFFENTNINESSGLNLTTQNLSFSQVNQAYPVEILRSGGYSVYKVKQGGYFYVFWVDTFNAATGQIDNEPAVYFTAYLSSNIGRVAFDKIKLGISTAEDVKAVDPAFELSFLHSGGIYSFSLLDEDTIMQIKYDFQGKADSYSNLIVKEMTAVPRDSVSSRYSAILSMDLP